MSAAIHTPGPWTMSRRQNNMIDIQHAMGDVKGAITHSLCRVQARESWLEEAAANARLISAAPDLLAALKGVLRVADRQTDEFDAARAAIAKAEGGDQ